MNKIIFILGITTLVLLFNIIPNLLFPEWNLVPFGWIDNQIYLGFIQHTSFPLSQNPYSVGQNYYMLIIPFIIIKIISFFSGIEWAYIFWVALINVLIFYSLFVLAKKINVAPIKLCIGYAFLNPGLYIISFFSNSGFQWTGIEWLKGNNLLLNLWHPLFITEILITVWLLVWLLDSKNNEWKIGLTPLLIYFSRSYMISLFLPLVFVWYFIKTKKINRSAIVSTAIIFLHFVWVNRFPEYARQISTYFLNEHYPTFWLVAGSIMLLLFFFYALWFFRFNKFSLYLLTGLFFAILINVITPLNIRMPLCYSMFLGIGAGIGFSLIKNNRVAFLALLLSFIVLFGSVGYTISKFSEYSDKYSDSDILRIKSYETKTGVFYGSEHESKEIVWRTALVPYYVNDIYDYLMRERINKGGWLE